jgi:SAM-dependent methyltransferase
MLEQLKYVIVKKIYADHNDAAPVRSAVRELLNGLPSDGRGVNVGAGRTRLDPRVKNMELEHGTGIDIVGSVEDMPCQSGSLDLVIAQEVLEHVSSPDVAVREMYRVLKPGGIAYIQLPFVIGYHPCPQDYWRFTHEGIRRLVESENFEVVKTGMTVGPAVGFYRIFVEFASIIFSMISSSLYRPAKLFFSIALYPLKWLDPILKRSNQADRIAGGYFVICRRK